MNLTKDEITKYVILFIILAGILYLLQLILACVRFMSGIHGLEQSLINIKPLITWFSFFSTRIVTAYYIHLSERRTGKNANIIWQLFGLIFGFIGFMGYGFWCLMVKNEGFISAEEIAKLPTPGKEKALVIDTEEEWECSECGATVSTDATVCPKCGADVSKVEED